MQGKKNLALGLNMIAEHIQFSNEKSINCSKVKDCPLNQRSKRSIAHLHLKKKKKGKRKNINFKWRKELETTRMLRFWRWDGSEEKYDKGEERTQMANEEKYNKP